MPFFGVPIRNGLPIGLGSVAGFGVQQFDPSQLFEGGTVPGAWYDPSDLSTMFTTAAGTTPVAMPGQGAAVPVGLMLDKSQGLVLGSELVTNGGPFVNTTGWLTTSATPLSVSSGILTGSTATATDALIYGAWLGNPGVLAANKYFEIKTTITALTGRVRFKIYGSNEVGPWITAPGTYTIRLYQTNANGNVGLNTDQATTVSILFFSVKQVAGNHAISFNNTTARPELRARVNLLTYSEEFDNAYWNKSQWPVTIAANTTATTDPLGGNTADKLEEQATNDRHGVFNAAALTGINGVSYTYSVYAKAAERSFLALDAYTSVNAVTWFDLSNGTVATNAAGSTATITAAGNGWYRCSVTRTATGGGATQYIGIYAAPSDNTFTYLGAAGSGIYIWGADLRPANIGANVPAYQRIADANTYDTSGFPLYLRFDGIDDSMYTPANLNLSGTDKVAVFAGVRKLDDAAGTYPLICEFSADWNVNNNCFGLFAGGAAAGQYFIGIKGTTRGWYEPQTYSAPISNVLCAQYNLAGANLAAQIVPRVNGLIEQENPSGSSGTPANFGSYPFFIGARNNASFFFNGHLHSLIIAGSAVSAGNISATEQWVAGKTGIAL